MYDTIIIGAGPAGLMCARTLKEKGVDNFLVIEAKKEIGKPLRCGEGIGCHEFHEFFDEINYEFIANRVVKHDIVYEDLTRTFSSDFYQLDRPKFEKWLSKDFVDKIMLSTKLKDVRINKQFAEVETNKGVFQGKIVVLCHGCNYDIQKKLGMMGKKILVVPCYGGLFENHRKDKDKFYFIFDKYPGAMWIFPKSENVANMGIGIYKHNINVKDFFSELKSKYKIEAKQISEYSGVFPAFGPIKRTYHDRLLICGNAAGFVFAGTGEGIYFALKSGELAAESCVMGLHKKRFDKRFLKRYESSWKRSFGKHLRAGVIFLDLLSMGYRFKKMKSMFRSPNEGELKDMVLNGKIPKRAMTLWRLSKIFNLNNKKEIPKCFTILYKILRKK